MQLLVYLITYPVLWIISRLPYRLFYLLSDALFVLLYYIVGYRKKVVWENLKLVFPEKGDAEIHRLRFKFYEHMCDMFLELVKTMSMTPDQVRKHYVVSNIELLQEIEREKSVLIVCGHYANWEWNTSINLYVKSKGYAIYQKIQNPYFEKLVKRIRSKWNTNPITQRETVKTVIRNEQLGIRAMYGMVSDQSPMAQLAQFWGKFMGITVPVYTGPENLARKLDLAVVFGKVSKLKRGYYSMELIPITRRGKETAEHEITNRFLDLLEMQIREAPQYYLWTHRRWKHRDKAPVKEVETV